MATNKVDIEQLFGAIDIITQERIKELSFDKTVIGTIEDDKDKKNGKYLISDGTITFYAYSTDTQYKNNDVVMITIPQGDYDKQKIIVGKYVNNTSLPFAYKDPFDSMIDLTGNLIKGSSLGKKLLANDDREAGDEISIYRSEITTPLALTGYTQLGLKAEFLSLLKNFKVISGDYGLRLKLTINKPDLVSQENKTIIKIFQLGVNQMYGDPYNFDSYYEQQAIFKLDEDDIITKIELCFYQSNNFKDINGNGIPCKDEIFEDEYLNYNLYVKDPYLCFGHNAAEFLDDSALLYTFDTLTYKANAKNIQNSKIINLRWIHKYEDQKIKTVNNLLEGAKIYWYRYVLGSPSADEYSGVYWQLIPSEDEFSYQLNPDFNLESERIKVIIVYKDKIIRSNILTFMNENEVPNLVTENQITALWLKCNDESNGVYCVYGNNNKIIDKNLSSRIRKITCMFKDNELSDVEYIKWTFPYEYTMIMPVLSDGSDLFKISKNNNTYEITYGQLHNSIQTSSTVPPSIIQGNPSIEEWQDKIEENLLNSINFVIKDTYNQAYTDNTILCEVIKDRILYSTSINLRFGQAGTNGSDYTLTISYETLNRGAINESPLFIPDNAIESDGNVHHYKLIAQLQDQTGSYLDFNNDSIFNGTTMTWDWFYSKGIGTIETRYYKINNENILTSRKERELLNLSTNITEEKYYEKENEDTYFISNTKYQDTTEYYIVKKVLENNVSNITITNSFNEDQCNWYETYLISSQNLTMNELYIIRCTLSGFGDYDLVSYMPLALKNTAIGYKYENFKGPEIIRYDSLGNIDYFKNPCELIVKNTEEEQVSELNYKIYNPLEEKYIASLNNNNILQPLNTYVPKAEQYGIQVKQGNNILWTQAVLTYQNDWPNGTVNEWDGKKLELNEENNYILGHAISAGKKENDNSFTGVMLGDLGVFDNIENSLTRNTGIYGFHHGAVSYALKDDGTAFIGKSGRGRIVFNGNEGTITSSFFGDKPGVKIDLDSSPFLQIKGYSQGNNLNTIVNIGDGIDSCYIQSANYADGNNSGSGIKIDLNNGRILALGNFLLSAKNNDTGSIEINTGNEDTPLKIGDKFTVQWDGTLNASGAKIEGNITMNSGSISWAGVTPETYAPIEEAMYTAYGAQNNLDKLANGKYSGTFIDGKMLYSPNIIGNKIAVRPDQSQQDGKPGFVLYNFKPEKTITYYIVAAQNPDSNMFYLKQTQSSDELLSNFSSQDIDQSILTSESVIFYTLDLNGTKIERINNNREKFEGQVMLKKIKNNERDKDEYAIVKIEDCEQNNGIYYIPSSEILTALGSIGAGKGSTGEDVTNGIAMAYGNCLTNGTGIDYTKDGSYVIVTNRGARLTYQESREESNRTIVENSQIYVTEGSANIQLNGVSLSFVNNHINVPPEDIIQIHTSLDAHSDTIKSLSLKSLGNITIDSSKSLSLRGSENIMIDSSGSSGGGASQIVLKSNNSIITIDSNDNVNIATKNFIVNAQNQQGIYAHFA